MTRGKENGERTRGAPPSVIRTEGQRLLVAVKDTYETIADRCGFRSSGAVSEWRSGSKTPSPGARARLFAAYQIPPRAWTVRPGGTLEAPPDEAVEAAANGGTPTTLEDCLALAAVLRRERKAEGLIPSERVKLATAESQILTLRARLEQSSEYAEARYVTAHPSWRKLRAAIVAALEPHPTAAAAVLEAITRVEQSR